MESWVHGSLHGLGDIKLFDGKSLPTTRFPDLDVYDHGFDHLSRQAIDASRSLSVRCTSLGSRENGDEYWERRILGDLERYAQFIIDFTGEDTVSFWCHIATVECSWRGVLVGTRPVVWGERCHLQSLRKEISTHVSQFSYSFNAAECCDDEHIIYSFQDSRLCDTSLKIIISGIDAPSASVESLQGSIERYFYSPDASLKNKFEGDNSDLSLSVLEHQSQSNAPPNAAPNLASLHEMFEMQAKQNPDRCAIEFLNPDVARESPLRRTMLSYQQLNLESDSIAATLREIFRSKTGDGLQNSVVPVFIPTSPKLYTAYLAILKAGHAFCPLPIDVPAQRLSEMLKDIQPVVVLGVGPEPENGPWHEASRSSKTVWLDIENCAKRPRISSLSQPLKDCLAYVMFTSGSTGKPKGVKITHRAAISSTLAHLERYENTMPPKVPMRWYQFAAPTFDPSIMEIFVTLSNGGTLCAAPREMTLSAPETAITETRSTITMATPGLAAIFDTHRLPTIQCVWTMGETLSRQVIEKFTKLDPVSPQIVVETEVFRPRVCLCNAYGPTEAAINVTFLPNITRRMRGSIIGYPLGTSRLLVIDPIAPGIRPVPLGFAGELVIAGDQLALGYICEQTQELPAFLHDDHYGRLYRTGDRARVVWDSHNIPLLEYLGRMSDDQTKINGQRVELGEIESVLCDIPMVRSAVVIVHDHSQELKGESLVACLISEPVVASNSNTIEDQCRDISALRLPSHMRPKRFLQLQHVPKTSAGKVNRKEIARIVHDSLSKDLESRGESIKSFDARAEIPGDLEEEHSLRQSLSCALSKTFGVPQLAPEYLQQELDSLSAIRFLRNIKGEGIESLSLRDVLQSRSIEILAQTVLDRSLDQQRGRHSAEGHVPVDSMSQFLDFRSCWQPTIQEHFKLAAEDICDVLPITDAQSRILLSFSASPAKSTKSKNYVHHSLHTFRNEIDVHSLKVIWGSMMQQHDAYRTVFMPVDDDLSAFAQVILNSSHRMAQPRWLEKDSNVESDEDLSIVAGATQEAERLITLETSTPVLTLLKGSKQISILISMIHAIFDLRSLQLLIADIAIALAGKKPGHRTEMRTAVEAHFVHQTAEMIAFWNECSSHPESSPFPSLTSIRPEATNGLTLSCHITSKLTLTGLETRSRNLLCSSLSVLQAAWGAILIAYTSSTTTDAIFGSLLADRVDENRSNCVAPMFNIVPTRVRSDASSLNIDIFRSLTDGNAKAKLNLCPSIRGKGNTTKPFDTTIALQMFDEIDELKEIWHDTVILPMAHDYAVMIEASPDSKGQLCFKAVFSDSYLDQSCAELMLSQLDEILIWMLTNPMLPYFEALSCPGPGKLSILNPEPKTNTMKDFSSLHSQFEFHANAHPENCALEFWHALNGTPSSVQRWSYRELNVRADKLADSLIARFGDIRDLVIPVLMEKRPELYIAILAILKAGAGWSPIDINSPAKRRKDLISRVGAKVVLVSPDAPMETFGIPEDVEMVRVSLNSEEDGNGVVHHHKINQPQAPESLAYVIWTSGTTGPPKGVLVSHRAVCASMEALQANIPYKTRSGTAPRCIQFAQQTFDVFVQDLFCTWDAGGTVISASKELMTGSFSSLCYKSEATHAHLTPAFAATIKRNSCPSLETVTMIGEKLPQWIADDWGQNIRAYNTYGPAEAAVVSTFNEFGMERNCIKSSNIGRPLPSVSCKVVRNGEIVMTQGVGELALGGPQIAQGYIGDVERTEAKFKQHGSSETKVYLTGDIVRQLADGTIEFIGREDDLVKLGGIRVELSEISHSMMGSHELINQIETLHLNRADRPQNALISFIAANIGPKPEEPVREAHRQLLHMTEGVEITKAAMLRARQSLPPFMVPSNVVILQSIPKTSSAKIDRDALRKVYQNLDLESWEALVHDDESDNFDESSDIALNLRQCVSQFSGAPLETIHLSSSLHSLGIDSLSVVRFTQRLQKFNIALSVADILKCGTIAQALRMLKEIKPDANTQLEKKALITKFNEAWLPKAQSILGSGVLFVMPATPLQEGVLSESMLEKSSYWSNHFFELTPNVDVEKLKRAWDHVSATTEALRTAFLTPSEATHVDQLPYCPSPFLMVVLKDLVIDWIEFDASNRFEKVAKERADLIATQHQAAFFHQPPWAVTILNIDLDRHMMLTLHHSIHDNDSINILTDEVAAAYHGLALPNHDRITDALPNSVDFAGSRDDESYWREILKQFADIPMTSWPHLSERDRPVGQKDSRMMLSAKVNLDLTREGLNHISRKLGIDSSVLFKVAFGCMLLDYLDASKVVFGELVSQRAVNSEYKDVVAPLIAVKPVPFTGKDTAMEIISEQSDLSARSRSHESLSGPQMRKILKRPRNQPLYSAVFVFHPPAEDSADDNTTQTKLWHQSKDFLGLSVEHDVALNVYVAEELTFEVISKHSVMDQDDLQTFCSQIKALTHSMLKTPTQALRGVLDNAGRDIISISESKLEAPEDSSMNTEPTYWLEHYAKRQPDWIAVEVASSGSHGDFKTAKWNFHTLYTKSCQIANFLGNKVSRGSTIAVCTGRTLISYAIVAGIFMSGNIYLPIDDSLPRQRKLLLIDDSDCSMLMTDGTCIHAFDTLPSSCTMFLVDELHLDERFRQKSDALSSAPNPEDSAYLIYTSGSTGKPKGVLISHRSLCGFVEGLTGFMKKCSTLAGSKAGIGKWLGLANRAFDVHLGEMFLAWRSGLAAVTAPREMLLDDLRLALTNLRVTHACFVPSLLEQAELEPNHIPEFVFMTIGGEKLSKRIIETWAGQSKITAVNAYGPTELAIGCTAAQIVPNMNPSNIGFPYGNTVAHILIPETFNYAKKGQSGELCFTGCLVGNGYLNRPEAKGFVHSFQGKRMYRTGDMARMRPDGSIIYLGRSDDQTKLRGQRMELSEISENIRASSKTPIEVVTLLVEHPELSSTFLTSFISEARERAKRYDANPELAGERLRAATVHCKQQCKQTLPVFMVPDYVIPVSIIPLARTSGKADTRSLKSFFASLSISELFGAISGAIDGPNQKKRILREPERQIAGIIRKNLKLGSNIEIEPDSNLFAMGLDSLNAVGLILRLREIGLNCTLGLLLGNPTIESIAAQGEWNAAPLHSVDFSTAMNRYGLPIDKIFDRMDSRVPRTAVEKILPCMPMQESTLTAALTSQSSRLYVNHVVLELNSSIDLVRFQRSWHGLIAERPILRTVFVNCDDFFAQLVLRPEAIKIPWEHMKCDVRTSISAMISEIIRSKNDEILDEIEKKPPLRLQLITDGNTPPTFVISIHHALYDARSFEMIMKDIWLHYNMQPVPHRLTMESILDYRTAQDSTTRKLFWQQYLMNSSPQRIDELQITEGEASARIDELFHPDLSSIQALANSMKVTLSTLTQYLFTIAIARRLKRSDILFGVILSGILVPVEDAELIAAPCITTIPQRFQITANDSLLKSLHQTQIVISECLEHQHTSLRDIFRWAQLSLPMFDTLFSFNYETEKSQQSLFWTQVSDTMNLDFPLAVEVVANKSSNTLDITCVYTTMFGTIEDVHTLIEDMQLLMTMIQNGDDPKIFSLGVFEEATSSVTEDEQWDERHWSEVENKMQHVIHDFKGIKSEAITKNMSFFQLGIDSVSAIRLAKNLQKSNVSVRPTDIMRYPSIGSLGHHLSRKSNTGAKTVITASMTDKANVWDLTTAELDIATNSIEAVYECTPLQSGMLTSTLASGGHAYVHQHAYLLPSDVNIKRLSEAWILTQQSLDILRTCFFFASSQQKWIAYVLRQAQATDLGFIEESSLSQAYPSINLLGGHLREPLFNAAVVSDGNQTAFRLTSHHSLYDGHSLPMMFEVIFRAYEGLEQDQSQLTPFHQIAHDINERASQSGSFWLEKLRGYGKIEMHKEDHPVMQMISSRTCRISLESALGQCKALGVTLQSALLTAYAKLLATALGTRDVVFGHVVSGRSLPDIDCESIIGPMFNTVPLRIHFDNLLCSNVDVVKRVLDITTDGHAHQHASLAQIQGEWRKADESNNCRLFNSIFLFQNHSLNPPDQIWQPLELDQQSTPSEYCLNFEVEQTRSQLTITASCHKGCLVQSFLDELLQVYEDILHNILHYSAQKVGSHPPGLSSLPSGKAIVTPIRSFESDHEENSEAVQKVKDVLANVSGVPLKEISSSQSSFSLGLTSLSAITVAAECRKRGIDLSVADVLQGVSATGMCQLITKRQSNSTTGLYSPVAKTDEPNGLGESRASPIQFCNLLNPPVLEDQIEAIYPALSGQIYHLAGWLKSGRTVNMPTWSYAGPKLDIPRFQTAWVALQQRHPILRTTFATLNRIEVAQIVLRENSITHNCFKHDIGRVDLRSVRDYVRAEQQQPTDMSEPPVRIRIVRGLSHDVILLTIHHALYDAFSLPTLLFDLEKLYHSANLEPPSDWLRFVGQHGSSHLSSNESGFWKKALNYFSPTMIYEPDISVNSNISSQRPQGFVAFPHALTNISGLSQTCHRHGVSLPTVLILSFARALVGATNIANPVFGLFSHGRSSAFPGASNLAGPCLNMLPFIVPSPFEEPWYLKAQEIQEHLLERISYDQSHLPAVLQCAEEDLREFPGFNTFFNILWSDIPSARDTENDEGSGLFKLIDVGVPSDFVPEEKFKGESLLEELRWPVTDHGIYVDIALSQDRESVSINARIEESKMSDEKVRSFLIGIVSAAKEMLKPA